MIHQLNDTTPVKVASFADWTTVYVQNRGAVPVHIDQERGQLENPSGALAGGLVIYPAGPIQRLWWRGEFWIAPEAAGAVVAVVPVS